jgi:hypothetical protein
MRMVAGGLVLTGILLFSDENRIFIKNLFLLCILHTCREIPSDENRVF